MKQYCFVFLILIPYASDAQMLSGNNATVSIAAGNQLTVKGEVRLEAGMTIESAGTIDLNGNWTNNSATPGFTLNDGTVIMNGVNQVIGGSSATIFYHLNLFNGVKTLQSDATTGGAISSTTGSLNCNNAVLDLNSHTFYINNINPNGITRTTGYILSEDVDNSSSVWWRYFGQGYHTIPFGNAAGEDVSFEFSGGIGLPGTTSSDLVISTYATASNNTPYPFTPDLVTHVNGITGTDNSANCADRFWRVSINGSADYIFHYPVSENAGNGNSNMRAQKWDNATLGWQFPIPGQSNPSAQSVAVPNVSTNGSWTLAMESTPLPVSLLTFTATLENESSVLCRWITASEVNNDFFILQRSRNGFDFEDVTRIDGAGNSNSMINYSFRDSYPFPGVSYYRLRQVDYDGTFAYSQIAAVNIPDKENSFNIFPNPSNGFAYILWDSEYEITSIAVNDLLGKKLSCINMDNSAGLRELNLSHLPNGIYLIQVFMNGQWFTEKIQILK